jgi:glyoxylase-like metal-dependent hydrolase (beta-lactamase superfamily II)
MLVAGFAVGPWSTNCWVVAPATGSECLIIDPGHEVMPQLQARLQEHRLKPVAVLLTHGHIDHMWSVVPVADGYGVPALIHENDAHLLAHPELGVSEQGRAMIAMLGGQFRDPHKVSTYSERTNLSIAGLDVNLDPAPGHTPGSVVYRIQTQSDERLFSGDVLFQGAIGRTDLPGGNHEQMLHSLANVILPLADELVVHPGHGQDTTIGIERRTNPYLRGLEML